MEIDLKKTPLSEIDLTKIDYDKSYVIHKNCKYLIIENSIKYYEDGLYEMNSNPRRGFLFCPNGNHYYKEATLHLFYKEEKRCGNCLFLIKTSIGLICDADRCNNNRSGWQPKESVSIGGGWFVEDSSKKKNTISESINKRVKELQNDSMIDYVSMNHIAQHGVNDSLKEVYCFIKAIIEYLEVTNANK